MKKISPKKKAQNAEWKKVCLEKLEEQIDTRGYNYCELCNLSGKPYSEWNRLDGHHINKNRNHNIKENCRLLHRLCHMKVHGVNIKE